MEVLYLKLETILKKMTKKKSSIYLHGNTFVRTTHMQEVT